MASFLGKIREFRLEDSDWNIFKPRLEQYFIANKIEDENMKKAILLNACDEEAYRLVFSLCIPKPPEEKKYEELVNILDKHFQSIIRPFAARFKFYNAVKNGEESIQQWAARVRSLATHCAFGNELNVVLRDKFIMGLDDTRIMEKIFEEDAAVEFDKIIQIANSHIGKTGTKSEFFKEEVFFHQMKNQRGQLRGSAKPIRNQSHEDGRAQKTSSSREGTPTMLCQICGRTNHRQDKCRFKNYACNICKQLGHLAKMCEMNKRNHYLEELDDTSIDNEFDEAVDTLFKLHSENENKKLGAIKLNVSINHKNFIFELDTGASVSVVSYDFWKKHLSEFVINEPQKALMSYDGSIIKPKGYIKVNICYKTSTKEIELYVIVKGGPPLLGRDFFNLFELSIYHINSRLDRLKEKLMNDFPNVFSPCLGRYTGGTIHLRLINDWKPKFFKCRPLPFALREGVERELERLVNDGILIPVSYSQWGTPIVPVVKSDGGIRICGDYKITLNPVLHVDRYPLPLIEDLFHKLQGGIHFTKIDLTNAYQQVELDDDSALLTTISTHKGLFAYKRLPFGINSAPSLFQEIMEKLLAGLNGVVVFIDDILMTGKDEIEHMNRVREVLKRLNDSGFTISMNKCDFF